MLFIKQTDENKTQSQQQQFMNKKRRIRTIRTHLNVEKTVYLAFTTLSVMVVIMNVRQDFKCSRMMETRNMTK